MESKAILGEYKMQQNFNVVVCDNKNISTLYYYPTNDECPWWLTYMITKWVNEINNYIQQSKVKFQTLWPSM